MKLRNGINSHNTSKTRLLSSNCELSNYSVKAEWMALIRFGTQNFLFGFDIIFRVVGFLCTYW